MTVKEVEGAIGLHTSIVAGYYAVLKKAEEDRPESLSLTETLALMKAGGQGAIKLRKPPAEHPTPKDPILAAPGSDALPFPVRRVRGRGWGAAAQGPLRDFRDDLRSWSASQTYHDENGTDPVALVASEIAAAWGDVPVRRARWPLFARVGRIV